MTCKDAKVFVIFDHFWKLRTFYQYVPSSIAVAHQWFSCNSTAHIVKPGSALVYGEYPENQINQTFDNTH